MIYTELTKRAICIAFHAHEGQKDRGDVPYVCHPLHLAEEMPDEGSVLTALLHDVLEDSSLTETDLRAEGMPESVIRSVRLLSRDRNTSYSSYIDSIIDSGDETALRVKYADLCHNMDETRISSGELPDHLRLRYRAAKKKIAEALARCQEVHTLGQSVSEP